MKRDIKGWKIGYSADFDVFPVDPRIAAVVADAVRAFEDAGAHVEPVKLGIRHTQRELSDAWSRLMMPLNLGTFEAVKAAGLDLLADHRDDFPPEYLHWIEVGQRMTMMDLMHDQAIRSEVYDAVQGAFATYDLIVTPTLAAMPVREPRRRQHHRPEQRQRRGGRPADRLVPHLPDQLHRPPRGVDSGRRGRRPAGRHADHRPPLRRRRRARRAFEALRPWAEHAAAAMGRAAGSAA